MLGKIPELKIVDQLLPTTKRIRSNLAQMKTSIGVKWTLMKTKPKTIPVQLHIINMKKNYR
jgi:hypothetical protein